MGHIGLRPVTSEWWDIGLSGSAELTVEALVGGDWWLVVLNRTPNTRNPTPNKD